MQGGLSMPLAELTLANVIGAVALIAYSLWVFPRNVKQFGTLNLAQARRIRYDSVPGQAHPSPNFRSISILMQVFLDGVTRPVQAYNV